MNPRQLLTGRGLWLLSIGVLAIVTFALVLFRVAAGSSDQLDVDRLVRENKALVAEATASVTITETGPLGLARVDTVPVLLMIPAGETTAIAALAYDQQGRQWQDASFRWKVVDPDVGYISLGGVFTAGFTIGTYEDAVVVEAVDRASGVLVEATATITVIETGRNRVPIDIRVFPGEVALEPNQSLKLVAFAVDLNGVMVPGASLKWELLKERAGVLGSGGEFTASERTGNFIEALRVSIPSTSLPGSETISAIVDVRVLDPRDHIEEPFVAMLPQIVTLNPGQEVNFAAVVLKPDGQRLSPVEVQWKLEHNRGGTLSENGRFISGDIPGIYENLVRAHIRAPEYEGGYATRVSATVVIAATPQAPTSDGRLASTVIFPPRLAASPGESTNLYLVSTDGDGQRLTDLRVRWSLAGPDLGQITQGGRLTVGSAPGAYPAGIIAEVVYNGPSGAITRVATATLVIRGPLDRVIISPDITEVGQKKRTQFSATAYDANGASIPTVLFRWRVVDPSVGDIDRTGLFLAKAPPGDYPNVVQVEAIQVLPDS